MLFMYVLHPRLSFLNSFGKQTCTRDALSAARPDYARNWKAQKPEKFAKAYNAVSLLPRDHINAFIPVLD
jgi:hypothetical protein